MPIATRRQAQARFQVADASVADDDIAAEGHFPRDGDGADSGEEQSQGDEDEDEDPDLDPPFPPPGLKEISSLASWTVSTAKPGNGVAALRSPDTTQYWQSDGPQPHLLSIHFFKLVSIVHMRIFLDHEADESYTPTKIQFLAGMGVHDIQEFAEMSFEQPSGWIEVDFSNVGPIEDEDEDSPNDLYEVDWSKRPVLRAFLVQVRILENHQNGKDTHLRAVQLFARDESQPLRRPEPSPSKEVRQTRSRSRKQRKPQHVEVDNVKRASWMLEPDLR